MRRLFAVGAVLGVLAVGLAGCGGGAQPTLTIGAIYPTGGAQGEGGIEESRGAQLAVELANQRGGVNGRRIRLDLLDVERGGDAPAAIDRLHQRGVGLVIGSYGSTISQPASVAARRNRMLMWETGAVGEISPDAGAGQTFFRLPPKGRDLGARAVDFVRDQLSPLLAKHDGLRYAVAYVDDAYGRAVGLGAIDAIAGGGQTLAGAFPYDPRTFDAGELVSRIATTRPDVLFVSAYLADGVAIRRATIDQHVPLLASIGTSSSYCMPDFAKALGTGATGLFASDKPNATISRDRLTREASDALDWATRTYEARWHDQLSGAALAGFANTWALVAHVLPAATSLTPAGAARAALSTRLPTGSLPNGAGLDLAAGGQPDAGENRAAVSVIWQWTDPQTQAVVWPPPLATTPLRNIPIET